jgi:hypothetical protein
MKRRVVILGDEQHELKSQQFSRLKSIELPHHLVFEQFVNYFLAKMNLLAQTARFR